MAGEEYVICCVDDGGILHVASKRLHPKGTRRHFVCLTPRGSCVPRSVIHHALREHGLNSHSFRHTQATNLIADGVSPVAVAARLGHRNVETTLGIYAHDTEDQQKKIAREQERKFWADFFNS
ncbi:tyrosine-type recombinase/integrase [Selenomonas sp.]|uniref:tyrosine-type recombinase/integrase n=1 Tax=Selenomonas sp. TaxID=2053611 RepID=UPI0039BFBD3D